MTNMANAPVDLNKVSCYSQSKFFRYDVIIRTLGAFAGDKAVETISVTYHFVISAM